MCASPWSVLHGYACVPWVDDALTKFSSRLLGLLGLDQVSIIKRIVPHFFIFAVTATSLEFPSVAHPGLTLLALGYTFYRH